MLVFHLADDISLSYINKASEPEIDPLMGISLRLAFRKTLPGKNDDPTVVFLSVDPSTR